MPLSNQFMESLQRGHLSDLLSFIKSDRTICPEIREDTLTLYYRGGALLTLILANNIYKAVFSNNYVLKNQDGYYQLWAEEVKNIPQTMNQPEDVTSWIRLAPFLKAIMDRWFAKKGGLERESQQLIVLENNRDGKYANATDYYFCDIERAENEVNSEEKELGLRFDLVGVHWPSTRTERQITTNRSLVIAEAKYGDGSLKDGAGLVDHYQGLRAFIDMKGRLANLKKSMFSAFQQKHALGLIKIRNPLESFSDDSAPIQWMIILINHDPESTILSRELHALREVQIEDDKKRIQIKIATSNFMGYGLWDEAVFDLDDVLKSDQFLRRI